MRRSTAVFRLHLALVAILFAQMSASAATEQNSTSPSDSRTITGFSKVIPTVQLNTEIPKQPGMQMSLADRLQTITESPSSKDFSERLRAAEKRVQETSNPLDWGTILKISSVCFASGALLSQAGVSLPLLRDLNKAITSSVSLSWLPWLWIRPATKGFLIADIFLYTQIFGKPETIAYIRDHLWPTTVSTFRKILVSELWNRFWSGSFKLAGRLLNGQATSASANSSGSSKTGPQWLLDGHQFLVGTLFKGTKKIFQSAIQKHLETSILSVAVTASEAISTVVSDKG